MIAWGDIRPDDSDYWDEPVYADVDREARGTNRCDGCGVELADPKQALCTPCANDHWDRWHDRHDDIGPED